MKKQICIVLAVVAAGLASGCNDKSDMGPQGADAFTKEVQSVVATSSETALPKSIDAIMAVDADQAEPVAVY